MPPLPRTKAGRLAALKAGHIYVSKRGGKKSFKYNPNRKNARAKPRNFNYRNAAFASKAANMVRLKSLVDAELIVTCQFRQTVEFQTMGSGGGGTPCLLRVLMHNPTGAGGTGGTGTFLNIVDVVGYGGAHTPPSFTKSNPVGRIETLDQYFDVYRKGVVTSSNAKVRICGNINQKELGQYWSNAPAAGTQGEAGDYNANYMPYPQINEPSRDGDLKVWGVKQKQLGKLHEQGSGGDETPTLNDLKTKVPGIRMKQLRCYKDGHVSTPIMLSASHTNKQSFGITDWRDNIRELEIYPSTTLHGGINTMNKKCYFYVGICNKAPATAQLAPATVRAEVVVNYVVRFIDRRNAMDTNDAIPIPVHHEDL